MKNILLETSGLTKKFGGLTALNDVSLHLNTNEILGLIGPNGAGKTTFFNVINGVYAATSGSVKFLGKDVIGKKTYDMAHLGLARTHQIVKPLSEISVRENVEVGACFGGEGKTLSQAGDIAREVMAFVGLSEKSEQLAGSLNVAQKKRLELARALAAKPKLLLLDEVLAGLNPSEIAEMVETIKEIRDSGVSIIMIEHVMHAVMNVSDRMVVLDFGALIAEGTPEEIQNNEKVIEAYLGDPELAKRLSIQAE